MKVVLAGIVVPIILLITLLIATLALPSDIIVANIGQIYQALVAVTIIPIVVLLAKATKGYVFTKNTQLKNARVEFERIYDELMNIQNEDLYKLKAIANIFAIVDIALAALTVLGATFIKINKPIISQGVDALIKWMTLIAPLALVVMIFLSFKHRRIYKKIYKEQVISRFIKLVDKNLRYSLYGRVGDDMKNKYLVSDFETKAFNRFESEDYVDGKIDGHIYAEIAELNVDYAFKKKKRKFREDLFKGMFAVIRSEKDIGAWVKVTKNKFKLFAVRNRMETDNAAFEKIFDVYTDNRSVAHQLIQGNMIKTLMQFYKDYDLRFEVMFKDNIIFMRFFTPAMFEPKLFGNSIDKKLLFTYYNIIRFISEVVNEVETKTHEERTSEPEKVEESVKIIENSEIKNEKTEIKKQEKISTSVEILDVVEETKAQTKDKNKTKQEVIESDAMPRIEYTEINVIKERKKKSKA